jgi:MtN3 and saliva related transmembrane protein
MIDYKEILGLVAGSISSITFLPQVLKTAEEKSAKNISLPMFLLVAFSVVLWLAYGILLKSTAIIFTNTCVLIMSLIMIYLKLKYKNN